MAEDIPYSNSKGKIAQIIKINIIGKKNINKSQNHKRIVLVAVFEKQKYKGNQQKVFGGEETQDFF